jgi:hypothetical protein
LFNKVLNFYLLHFINLLKITEMIKITLFIILIVLVVCYYNMSPKGFYEYFADEYQESNCYTSGNRPYIIDGRSPRSAIPPLGSTARCTLKGGPQSWATPVWELSVSDPENPAYYNQFPSHMDQL